MKYPRRFSKESPSERHRDVFATASRRDHYVVKPSRSLLDFSMEPSQPAKPSRSALEVPANPSRRRHGEPIAGMFHEATVSALQRLCEDTRPMWVQENFATAPRGLREAPAAFQ